MIKYLLRCGTLVACFALLTCCIKETPELEAPTTDISTKFTDPVMRDYVGDVVGYMYFNYLSGQDGGGVIDDNFSVRNVSLIVVLNLARNYEGAPNISSLAGIKYMKSLKIIDLRNQNTLGGTYDLRQMSELYYLRIEGAQGARFIVTSKQRDRIMGTSGVFDGNVAQVIVI